MTVETAPSHGHRVLRSEHGILIGAMSQQNVEIIRRAVDAYLSGDNEAARACYDPEVELDVSSARPEGGVFRGAEGIEEALQAWVGTWPDYRTEVDEIVDAGDRVLMVVHEIGRGRGSGVEIDQLTFFVFTLRGDKIVRVQLFVDRDRALEAAGPPLDEPR